LEGIALVAIFFLDWRERQDERKERQAQHEETAAQLAASQKQVEAAIQPAPVAGAHGVLNGTVLWLVLRHSVRVKKKRNPAKEL
jgi:hypothetical protein